jgi:cell fate (sporulation/competence/biofilm development) regulator YmcA (YheA/YmcA/DUF963 family)
MEKFKDPAMLLSVANSIALVGTTAYFYKQLEATRLDLGKVAQTLQGVLRKLSEMEKNEQHKGEALHTLNDQIKRINEQLEEMPSLNETDNMDMDLSEIIAVLSENSIVVERPSQVGRYSRRSGDRKQSRRDSDVEERDRRDVGRRPARAVDNARTVDSTRSSRVESTHDRERTTQPARPAPSARQQPAPTQSYDNNDDTDLIGEVRRQQTRV